MRPENVLNPGENQGTDIPVMRVYLSPIVPIFRIRKMQDKNLPIIFN